ncbi:alkaline phosphatase [Desulfobacter latus]|uniref:Alkaline phosphatase n=2 Tax=Desulfobacter latus TaxID=2292 RepID=A0A850T7H9_9BACT|nr:alkaline phosphatase [Desulfobacter latus]
MTMRVFVLALVLTFIPLSGVFAKNAKYVFLFIGDGMGMPQRIAAEQYTGKKLLMNSFPAQGITTTHAADRFITGSAASATAMASGTKTNIGVIGMDPALRPVKTLAELAKEKGMKVGIVSSVSIDHATPAAFYAHVPRRSQYYDIDVAIANSGFDYFGGGGLKDVTNKKNNSKNYVGNAMDLIKKNGYKVVTDKAEFMALNAADGKVLAYNNWLQDGKALPYDMDKRSRDISLKEFTAKGIELLDNDKGFFMMVEAGKIDWACHANDATASIKDTLVFDDAISEAYEFYKKHPAETLIVVTGDHECGGLTLGYAGTKYATNFDVLGKQNLSFQKFTDEVLGKFKQGSDKSFNAMKPIITQHFGLTFEGNGPLALQAHEIKALKGAFDRSMKGEQEKSKNPETYVLYGGYEPLSVSITHILNQKAGLAWTSYKHTGVPVATSAVGVSAGLFNGYYDNVDIAKKTMDIMGIDEKIHYAEKSPINDVTFAAVN